MTATASAPVDDFDVYYEVHGSGQPLLLDSSPDTRR
jgi:hypothetical protein